MTTQPDPADRCTELTCPAHGETNRLLAENAELRERAEQAERQVREIREAMAAVVKRAEEGADAWGACSHEWSRIDELRALSGVSGPTDSVLVPKRLLAGLLDETDYEASNALHGEAARLLGRSGPTTEGASDG